MRNAGALIAHLRAFTFSAAERGTADDTVKRRPGATAATTRRARRRVRPAPGPVRGHAAVADDADDDFIQAGQGGGGDAREVEADAPGPHGGVVADEVVATVEDDAALAGVAGLFEPPTCSMCFTPVEADCCVMACGLVVCSCVSESDAGANRIALCGDRMQCPCGDAACNVPILAALAGRAG